MECLLEISNNFSSWDDFTSTINENPTARQITLESWKRCEKLGMNPNEVKFEFLSSGDVEKKKKENSKLTEVSSLYMDSLSMSLVNIPHIIALSDNDGWIIDFREKTEEQGGIIEGFSLGVNWSEENVGNNGIGTALALGQPILVYGEEHYGMPDCKCGCIGVPIINNENVIGAIGISVPVEHMNPIKLHSLIACINSIETAMKYISDKFSNTSTGINLAATSELIATAVHDLKNPLSVVRGLGQLGIATSDKARMDNYFNRIIKQVDEMNDMVVELLSIFKPEELTPQKVTTLIKDVLNSFQPICTHKNIKLSLIDNVDEYANISKKLLKRAIENLINNAIQAMDNGGSIEVITEKYKNSILIIIKDTAGGIPEEINKTLFEPFSFKRSGGTGLGLFMVYHTITNIHNGKIWFDTELGNGTTFFMKLPIIKNVENVSVRQFELT
ncbi:ATP-binding protein [Clostridium beijerinckii]|uniref:ATP-binding protein n=1 Tax=Clostridium beijerinckii TaxID=1520 RepID=UPI000479AEAF|nr:ATP-binding protein [Clostridium beijerinckii]